VRATEKPYKKAGKRTSLKLDKDISFRVLILYPLSSLSSSPSGSVDSRSPTLSDFSDISIALANMDVPSVLNPSDVSAPQVMNDNSSDPPHPRWYIQDDNVEFKVC
jgi:hypothetical protein